MNAFFNSEHCGESVRIHCARCRSPITGRRWRSTIAADFRLPDHEFECPHGQPWLPSVPSLLYKDVAQEVLAAPHEGLWALLKEELRLTEAALALHAWRFSACWARRQKARFIGFYEVAKAKTPPCNPP